MISLEHVLATFEMLAVMKPVVLNFRAADCVASSSSFEDSNKSSLLPPQSTNYRPQLAASSIIDNISAPIKSSSMLAPSSLSEMSSKQSSESAQIQNTTSHEKSVNTRLSSNESNQSITSSSVQNSLVYAGGDISNSRNSSSAKKCEQNSASKSNSALVRNAGLSVNARYTVSFHAQSPSQSPMLMGDSEKSSGSAKSRSLFGAVLSSNGL